MLGNVEVEDAPAIVSEHEKDEQDAQARGRNGEEIEGDQIRDVIGKERAPGLRGRLRRFGMSRETVRSATWKPSFRSSPWILGAPQRGLAAVIRVTRAAISGLTGGRPRVGRSESLVQCSRIPAPLPPQNGSRGHDHEGRPPPGPDSGQPEPKEAIRRAQLGSGRRSFVHGELLPQDKVLDRELAVAAEEEGGRVEGGAGK